MRKLWSIPFGIRYGKILIRASFFWTEIREMVRNGKRNNSWEIFKSFQSCDLHTMNSTNTMRKGVMIPVLCCSPSDCILFHSQLIIMSKFSFCVSCSPLEPFVPQKMHFVKMSIIICSSNQILMRVNARKSE